MSDRASYVPAAERIAVWTRLGAALVRDAHGWRLTAPAEWSWPRGPAPTPIPERAAREAIRAGAPVRGDLFGSAAA